MIFNHILRHERLVGTILGVVEGRKSIGRQRVEYVKKIIKDVGCSGYRDMKRLAQDRRGWKATSN